MQVFQEKRVSKSLLTNKQYDIPSVLDDKKQIDAFLSNHVGKKVVAVQGLGFVGAVMALVVANSDSNYAVIGVDLATEDSYWKINSINEGIFPVISSDLKVDKYFGNARERKNLYATYDSYAYSKADVIVVDINLDVKKVADADASLQDYDVSLDGFKKGIETIAKNCKDDVLILVETTVPPGTCIEVIKPLVDRIFAERGLERNYKLGHSYERVMPGPHYIDSIENFYRVYSGINESSANATEQFLKTIIKTDTYPLTRLASTTSTEMAKVLENSYRAMNIAFVQEWTEMATNANVNLHEVIAAIRMRPTHSNLMWPGLGVGGYCLTKDPLLASWANQHFFGGSNLEQSETSVKINDKMPLFTFNIIKSLTGNLPGKKVLILGVSYLNDVGDTRYTPVELLYNLLIKEDAIVTLHDPFVSHWDEKGIEVETELMQVIDKEYDIIVFATAHNEYKEAEKLISYLNSYSRKIILIDSNRVLKKEEVDVLKEKHVLRVIGRGDLN